MNTNQTKRLLFGRLPLNKKQMRQNKLKLLRMDHLHKQIRLLSKSNNKAIWYER
ncbi:unnamed protein product [Anisakis simplex]|uniref:Uncharacterized protein n=1 Tax=Anisakis simplex TaxID=6269 RepID=A0A0M3JQE2_ANISI|nr:unnamed protein product [Anisakis simplex]